jgi:uncharacterized membrane protein YcfT
MMAIGIIISFINNPICMYKNDYGEIPLFVVAALSGIVVIINCSKMIKCEWLSYIGKNSIIFYTVHVVVLKIFHGISNVVFHNTINNCEYPWYWLFFALTENCKMKCIRK